MMRGFFILTFLIGTLWAIDTFGYSGVYRRAAWVEARYQSQKANYEVRHWLKKVGL
jgi:hypothetical protein